MRHDYLPNLYLALFKRYISMCLSNSEATRGHKNTRQVTPWSVLPGGRNLPRFILWIGTDYHRRKPVKVSGRLGDRGDAGNRTPVRQQCNRTSPGAVC